MQHLLIGHLEGDAAGGAYLNKACHKRGTAPARGVLPIAGGASEPGSIFCHVIGQGGLQQQEQQNNSVAKCSSTGGEVLLDVARGT